MKIHSAGEKVGDTDLHSSNSLESRESQQSNADTRGSGYTGFATVFFEGGGQSSAGAAGTRQNDLGWCFNQELQCRIRARSVVQMLQGHPHVGAAGSFKGLYIGNGMIVNDNPD